MNTLNLIPKKKERLGDQLYGQILEQIVSGLLKEGDRLPSENQICRSFEVSRPVVREALMRLQADGLVRSRQGSGTFVLKRPPEALTRLAQGSDIAEMLRCFEVRAAIEGQAAAYAALRHTPAHLTRIAHAFQQLRQRLEARKAAGVADLAFHHAVAQASGNALFEQTLALLNDTIEQSMRIALSITQEGSAERARRVADEHQAIFDAIAQRDPLGADLAMRYHLNRSRQRVTDGQRDR